VKKTLNREQWTVGKAPRSVRWPAPQVRGCQVYGCGNLSYGNRYCERCEDEIAALDLTYQRQMEHHLRARARRALVVAWIRNGLDWVLEHWWVGALFLVFGGLMCLACGCLDAIVEWLQ
jgi:hypothetical protein